MSPRRGRPWADRAEAAWRATPDRTRSGIVAAALSALLVTSASYPSIGEAPPAWTALVPAVLGGLPVLVPASRPRLALLCCAVVIAWYAVAVADLPAAWVATVAVLYQVTAHGARVAPVAVAGAGGLILLASHLLSAWRIGYPWLEESLLFVVALPLLAVGWGSGTRQLRLRNAELRRMREAELAAAVAEERRRIAGDVHDVAAHHLAAIVVRARTGQRTSTGADQARDTLGAVADTAAEALTAIRAVVGILRDPGRPADLSPHPGAADLPALVEGARRAGLLVDAELPDAAAPLPAGVAVAAYRIVQESLTNVLRHAEAGSVTVSVRLDGAEVVVEVCDDGAAAPPAGPGHGLVGMRERAMALGGTLTAGPVPGGGGWRVAARLPVSAP